MFRNPFTSKLWSCSLKVNIVIRMWLGWTLTHCSCLSQPVAWRAKSHDRISDDSRLSQTAMHCNSEIGIFTAGKDCTWNSPILSIHGHPVRVPTGPISALLAACQQVITNVDTIPKPQCVRQRNASGRSRRESSLSKKMKRSKNVDKSLIREHFRKEKSVNHYTGWVRSDQLSSGGSVNSAIRNR